MIFVGGYRKVAAGREPLTSKETTQPLIQSTTQAKADFVFDLQLSRYLLFSALILASLSRAPPNSVAPKPVN